METMSIVIKWDTIDAERLSGTAHWYGTTSDRYFEILAFTSVDNKNKAYVLVKDDTIILRALTMDFDKKTIDAFVRYEVSKYMRGIY